MAKPIEIPADLSTLSVDELAELRTSVVEAARAIDATNEDLPAEDLATLETYLAGIAALDARSGELQTEAAEVASRREAAAAALAGLAEEPAAEAPAAEVAPEPAPAEAEAEPVLAAGVKTSVASFAAGNVPAPKQTPPPAPKAPLTVMRAGAGIPNIEQNTVLNDMSEVANAFLSLVSSTGRQNDPQMKAGVRKLSQNFTRARVATLRRQDREFSVDMTQSVEDQFAAIMAASDERTRFGSLGLAQSALTAAGGWCAPSETIYDLFGYETQAGLFDIAEVTARRGGISFTKGPDFMTIFGDADAGFIQTETQAIAGTEKPCYAIECPPFTEVRLDAIGYCITAPLLTNAAYPELVRRVINMVGLGHARRKSATTIARISTALSTAINWGEVGTPNSGVADVLAAVELQANRIRQSLAMDPKATIEGVAPYWMRGAFRNELTRRLSLDNPFRITDGDVDGWFAERGIRLQYVYDYQMLNTSATTVAGGTATWTAWPGKVELMLWPAGAFVRLVNDVINLDAVYDHDLLTHNEYTAAFVEEGFAIANTRGFGVKVEIGLNYNGAAGFPAIGAGEGVTIPVAA